jgi:hypothetical protein
MQTTAASIDEASRWRIAAQIGGRPRRLVNDPSKKEPGTDRENK